MTRFTLADLADPAKYEKYFIGSDQVFKKLSELRDQAVEVATNYPPYNIKKIDDTKYVIEMAVAGFGKQDIEVIFDNNKLVISGKTESTERDTYIWKGISNRAFTRHFTVADSVEIRNASILNGMLKIWLEAVIPESKKPKTIPISDEAPAAEFLSEEKDV
jgi:molecular chaperone IbpA